MLFNRKTDDAIGRIANGTPASTWLLEFLEIQRDYLDPLTITACQSHRHCGSTLTIHEVLAAVSDPTCADPRSLSAEALVRAPDDCQRTG